MPMKNLFLHQKMLFGLQSNSNVSHSYFQISSIYTILLDFPKTDQLVFIFISPNLMYEIANTSIGCKLLQNMRPLF